MKKRPYTPSFIRLPAAGGARPPVPEMTAFIHRPLHGGAGDESDGITGHCAWQEDHHDQSGHVAALS
tara:strand:+ start:430 stop:630 length:201 start_codon:yes stop_codon:yes gene_type:complete